MPGVVTGYHERDDDPPRQGGGTVALFLSLYLVLLAFFILLVALSDGVSRKSREILDGLNSQFANAEAGSAARLVSDLGNVVSPSEFMDRVSGVYEAAIPAARVKVLSPGRLMELDVHVDSLFEHDTESLRPAQRRAFAQLVAALSAPPPGVRYVVEASFGVADPENLMPVADSRALRRAAIVARAFADEGAPPGSVVAALEPGDPLQVRLIFRVQSLAPADLGEPR